MEKLKYEFKNQGLLQLALTQSGVDAKKNNERLEFIGDRVLGLAVAELLYKMFPNETEGELARRHAKLVSTNVLGIVARECGLDKMVRHGHMTGGRVHHMLANTMEAVLGAVYVDGGFEIARGIIVEIWTDLASRPSIASASIWTDVASRDATAPRDTKGTLQELVQKKDNGALPVYEDLGATGASHSPTFSVRVTAMGQSAVGEGTSKKVASVIAAKELLKILANQDNEN